MEKIKMVTGWFNRQKIAAKIAVGCTTLVIFCCLCSVPVSILGNMLPTPEVTLISQVSPTLKSDSETADLTETIISELTTPKIGFTATSETISSNTPELAPSETASPSSTPEPTFTSEPEALLPGLMPSDVVVNLENNGLSCNSVQQGELYYLRTCTLDTTNYSILVDIYGRTPFSVDLIDASILQFSSPDLELAANFLGFVATMPYNGALQQEARNWVEITIPTLTGYGDVREQSFAGVNFRLYGISTAITLELGDLP